MQSFEAMMAAAKQRAAAQMPTVAVAQARDPEVQAALAAAAAEGLCRAIEVKTEGDDAAAARRAVDLVRTGEAQFLMKGLLPTATLLKAVLDEAEGLRTGRTLSHAAVFEMPGRDRLLWVTDAAMNVAPDVERKGDILRNLLGATAAVGLVQPRVAVLAAVETVSKAMPVTQEADELALRAARGDYGALELQGPLSLDAAVSPDAAAHKGIGGPVAGRADALLVPDIEAGNILYKALVFYGGGTPAGLILGARAPILLVSRSDSPRSKLMSIALALLAAPNLGT